MIFNTAHYKKRTTIFYQNGFAIIENKRYSSQYCLKYITICMNLHLLNNLVSQDYTFHTLRSGCMIYYNFQTYSIFHLTMSAKLLSYFLDKSVWYILLVKNDFNASNTFNLYQNANCNY